MPVVTATSIADLLIRAEDEITTHRTTIHTQTTTDTDFDIDTETRTKTKTNTDTDTDTDTDTGTETTTTTQRKGVVAADTTTTTKTTPPADTSPTAGAIDDAKGVKAKCSSAGWTSTECQNQSQGWIETHWWAFIIVGVGLIAIAYFLYKWISGRRKEKKRKAEQKFELEKEKAKASSMPYLPR